MSTMLNLDYMAAQAAQNMVRAALAEKSDHDDVENMITKALGVLQENGPYAATLFLLTRSRKQDDAVARCVRPELFRLGCDLLAKRPLAEPSKPEQALEFASKEFCADVDNMLLVKQLWEQALIYGRYGAKAQGKKPG